MHALLDEMVPDPTRSDTATLPAGPEHGYSYTYYPEDLVLPDLVLPTLTQTQILFTFFGTATLVILALIGTSFFFFTTTTTTGSSNNYAPKHTALSSSSSSLSSPPTIRRCFAFTWFGFCGLLHTLFEGYFVLSRHALRRNNDIVAQCWKEYVKCDSRYLTVDPTVWGVEAWVALVAGPAALGTAKLVRDGDPRRFLVQLLVSIPQFYGTVLYLLTSYLDDDKHSRPEPLYRIVYLYLLNGIWLIIPLYFIIESVVVLNKLMMARMASTGRAGGGRMRGKNKSVGKEE